MCYAQYTLVSAAYSARFFQGYATYTMSRTCTFGILNVQCEGVYNKNLMVISVQQVLLIQMVCE